MEALKRLLGDAYKEGMTLEELNTTISGLNLINSDKEKVISKATFDKTASEAAEFKKKWKELLSEDEQKTLAQQDLQKQLEEYKEKEKRLTIEKDLSKVGLKDEQIKTLTDSFLKGDTASFVETLSGIKTEIATTVKAQTTQELLIKNNPEPPAGSGGGTITKEKFAKMGYEEQLKLYEEDRALYDQLSN